MMYYTVYVEDHITHEKVTVLDLATRSEASDIIRYISKFGACTVYAIECNFIKDRKDLNK